jgi:isopentenyl-diphosphate delta-isomerase
VRDGLDVAKAIALGADLAGMAGPFLRAAVLGAEEAHNLAREVVEVLRIAMFCVGARTPRELRGRRLVDRKRAVGDRRASEASGELM